MHGMLHPHDSSLAFGMVLFTNIHQSTSNNESRTYHAPLTPITEAKPQDSAVSADACHAKGTSQKHRECYHIPTPLVREEEAIHVFFDTAGAANCSSSGAEVYSAAASAMAFSRLAASRASLSDLSFSFLSLLAITAAAFSASILSLCCFTCARQKQTRQPRSNPPKCWT
jgi:hypothetical protein